ncbi:MAG: ATP-dependent helicase RecQ [Thermoleophilaceae bacterium]|nr:ATP-dependent helicase RecQ [Thermoleophilaceae bacterium]
MGPSLRCSREFFATSVTGRKRERNIGVQPADPAGTVTFVDPAAALDEYFGFTGFRPGQREAVDAALAGRDVLVVMPTGSGKSLCYQLPALLREDLTIVVSPLVALMQDQVDALRARGLGDRVALVNAQQDGATNADALARACGGEVRLLYVAPERFSSPGFVDRIGRARIGLFVVDEAHCVSQWGHDFRPDYFRLADAARHLGAEAIVASTATATPQVAGDIVRRLSLRDPVRVATGFDRPNLAFAVARPAPHEKRPMLTELLRRDDALPAIVYAGTRAGSEELRDHLRAELGGAVVEMYHAGLERGDRADVQRRFLADQVQVIVATNAFGMGVDKPNVRTVVHASVPASLEAYYQEAGRAGRDGAPARAVLLAENRDKALHVHFIKRDEVDEKLPGRLAARLASESHDGSLPGMGPARYEVDAIGLARSIGVSGEQLRSLTGHLARAGVIEPTPSSPDRLIGRVVGKFDARAMGLCRTSVGEAGKARWRQYRDIWAYVESGDCRRRSILRHFGDRSDPQPRGDCCDACGAELVPEPPRPEPADIASLDDAIVSVARFAKPSVGRTTCAEILHGARTKKIERNSYDGLPAYGTSANMRRADILARIDELIEEKRLQTSGGPYPVLLAPPSPVAA